MIPIPWDELKEGMEGHFDHHESLKNHVIAKKTESHACFDFEGVLFVLGRNDYDRLIFRRPEADKWAKHKAHLRDYWTNDGSIEMFTDILDTIKALEAKGE